MAACFIAMAVVFGVGSAIGVPWWVVWPLGLVLGIAAFCFMADAQQEIVDAAQRKPLFESDYKRASDVFTGRDEK